MYGSHAVWAELASCAAPVYRDHSIVYIIVLKMINCPLCLGRFETISHIRLTHADAENFILQCNLQNCKRTFTKFSSYRNHIYNYHDLGALVSQEENRFEDQEYTLTNCTCGGIAESYDMEDEPTYICSDQDILVPSSVQLEPQDIQKSAATWILKIRECHQIPLSVMDCIIADTQSLFNLALYQISEHIDAIMKSGNVDNSIVRNVLSELNVSSSPYGNMFHHLQTQAQQMQYFRDEFNLVVSHMYRSE